MTTKLKLKSTTRPAPSKDQNIYVVNGKVIPSDDHAQITHDYSLLVMAQEGAPDAYKLTEAETMAVLSKHPGDGNQEDVALARLQALVDQNNAKSEPMPDLNNGVVGSGIMDDWDRTASDAAAVIGERVSEHLSAAIEGQTVYRGTPLTVVHDVFQMFPNKEYLAWPRPNTWYAGAEQNKSGSKTILPEGSNELPDHQKDKDQTFYGRMFDLFPLGKQLKDAIKITNALANKRTEYVLTDDDRNTWKRVADEQDKGKDLDTLTKTQRIELNTTYTNKRGAAINRLRVAVGLIHAWHTIDKYDGMSWHWSNGEFNARSKKPLVLRWENKNKKAPGAIPGDDTGPIAIEPFNRKVSLLGRAFAHAKKTGNPNIIVALKDSAVTGARRAPDPTANKIPQRPTAAQADEMVSALNAVFEVDAMRAEFHKLMQKADEGDEALENLDQLGNHLSRFLSGYHNRIKEIHAANERARRETDQASKKSA